MNVFKLHADIDLKEALKTIGVDKGGLNILASKMQYHLIKIEQLHVAAANILKQDALSIGADLAVPKGVVTCEVKEVDAILMATTKQLHMLTLKARAQPFGLKTLATLLQRFTLPKPKTAQIMGVINANADSFYPSSRFQGEAALQAMTTMIEEGADIIDIGGVSSRPGSVAVSAQEELARLKPIIDLIFTTKLYEARPFSIDSYTPEVIEYALSNGFRIVNDITGLENNDVCKLAAAHKAQVIIMHMQGTPQTMQQNPSYTHLMAQMDGFFKERIAKAQSFGIEDIVLDVGIGFGKTLAHNAFLIRHMEHFLSFGYPLLLGASRKSMIDAITPTPLEERLPGTLALHLEGFKNGASILRCHDVKAHKQALSVQHYLEQVGITS